jgi:hypothetical protein
MDAIPKIHVREKVAPKKRKALTRAQVIELCQRQSGGAILCGCGCGNVLRPKCTDEHIVARHTLTPELADRIDNRGLWNDECSKRKTPGDQAIIAHGRHVRGETGQRARRERRGHGSIKAPPVSALSKDARGYVKRKILSRGFGK